MKVTGLGNYIAIMVEEEAASSGEVTADFDELGLKGGDYVFFNPSEISIKDVDEERVFVIVRPEDIYAKVE